MSYCKQEGKDTVIFVTKEDHEGPVTREIISVLDDDPEDEGEAGLILPNGDINWGCPCLGGMASGPCGIEFREAFSCFHYSEVEPKGSDCIDKFRDMQSCMVQYPELYPVNGNDDDEEKEEEDDDIDGGMSSIPEKTIEEASNTDSYEKDS